MKLVAGVLIVVGLIAVGSGSTTLVQLRLSDFVEVSDLVAASLITLGGLGMIVLAYEILNKRNK